MYGSITYNKFAARFCFAESEKLSAPSAMGRLGRRYNMALPEGRSGRGGMYCRACQVWASGRVPDLDNHPALRTVMRRVSPDGRFSAGSGTSSSVTSEPGGGILLSNAIAGISSMSVSRTCATFVVVPPHEPHQGIRLDYQARPRAGATGGSSLHRHLWSSRRRNCPTVGWSGILGRSPRTRSGANRTGRTAGRSVIAACRKVQGAAADHRPDCRGGPHVLV